MRISQYTRRFLILAASAALLGCTTFVAKEKKDASYKGRLVEASVLWMPQSAINARVNRSAPGMQPTISDKDRDGANLATRELVSLFGKSSVPIMSKALSEQRVSVVSENSTAVTQLRIMPTMSDTDCAPLGCIHSLWIEASLFDYNVNKVVWSGTFKVGAPFLAKNDESVVESFASSVIASLKRARLL